MSSCGLTRVSQGKVRDTWRLNLDRLLVVATDRISIFDFVLNALITKKGEVLTALTHFWLTKVLGDKFSHHLVASKIDERFNAAYGLKAGRLPNLPIERCLVVKDLTGLIYIFEMIFRLFIGGSVFKKYQETSMAGGHLLPPNLPKWSKLDKPIFTPSTKEDVGHDVNVDVDYFFAEMTKTKSRAEIEAVVENLAKAYLKAYEYAESRGVLILDTKFEVAGMEIVDEILTPDSSRFALAEDWKKAMAEGRDPYFYDKQIVRDWGSKVETPFGVVGINKLNPANPEHVSFVHSLELPDEISQETTRRYLTIFKLITSCSLEDYQREEMGVEI
ncbi:MAG: phosphoribosylaminoimidazolesuccinocarboxamide synthase [Patescibacteria group bacterium]